MSLYDINKLVQLYDHIIGSTDWLILYIDNYKDGKIEIEEKNFLLEIEKNIKSIKNETIKILKEGSD